jgi:hypothetical protein
MVMRTLFITLCLLLFAVPHLFAKVGAVQLAELAEGSDLIVIAKVESVTKPLIGRQHAIARVLDVWKGSPTESAKFVSSPSWTCDISEAVEGEMVVLFLEKSDRRGSYTIAHAGRGRMPLRTVDGATYATFWPEVRLPEGTPTVDGPEPQWDFIRSVELGILRDLVEDAMREKE